MQKFTKNSIRMTSILCGDFPKADVFVSPDSPFWQGLFSLDGLNAYGYRCDEFDKQADTRIVTIGCSDAYGWFIDRPDRFSDVVASKYDSVANWNIALPSVSNEWIHLMTLLSIEHLKPTAIVVCFTRMVRKLHFGDDQCLNYLPAHHNTLALKKLYKSNRSWAEEAFDHLDALANYNNDLLHFYLNYKAVKNACDSAGVSFVFTMSLNRVGLQDIRDFVDKENYAGYFKFVDSAPHNHPGPESHRLIGEKIYRKLSEV